MSVIVNAGPTKRFFVTMLTRDIDLKDAILDLLDNCVDGILRTIRDDNARAEDEAPVKPYDGHWAKITANKERFEITDNCGGIPRKTAINSAFMLGRPDPTQDADLPTVGMYGIGMKRAIFKMGESCVVRSHPETGAYKVEISKKWMENDKDWQLSLQDLKHGFADEEGNEVRGTQIQIEDLRPDIRFQFNSNTSTFLTDLADDISRLFALIMEKGFKIELNGNAINPIEMAILAPDSISREKKQGIRPYVFTGEIDEVSVFLCVGFYRPLAREKEIEDTLNEPRASKDEAGWTVICNDRVVLHADKTHLTGWGTATVPGYHNQFISIAGIVVFTSNTAIKLPVNTTKRGLDVSSRLYTTVLDYMRQGLKRFTDFTNKWKTREQETVEAFKGLQRVKPAELLRRVDRGAWTTIRKVPGGARQVLPDLPMPEEKDPTRRVVFTRLEEDVRTVSKFLFDRADVSPSAVGDRCFENTLQEARA
jgi:hypothetical protein